MLSHAEPNYAIRIYYSRSVGLKIYDAKRG